MRVGGHCKDSSASELELVASMAAGDRDALAALYDRYGGLLMALAMRILQDEAEAEDLLHDVFVEAWQKAGSYDPARGSVRTWLCMRMRSRALDRARLSRRTRSESIGDGEPARQDPLQPLCLDPGHEVMQREQLRLAMAALSDVQRRVITLVYFSGLSCSEIAHSLKVPVGTVKSRLAGARKGLERAMSTSTGATP